MRRIFSFKRFFQKYPYTLPYSTLPRTAIRPLTNIALTDPDNVDKSGNVFLIRLLHGLYEDCGGGLDESAVSALEKYAL